MAKLAKIISIAFLIVLLVFPVASYAFPTFDDMKGDAEKWLNQGEKGSVISETKVAEIMLPIGQFLMGIGTVVLIVVTIILGIKYMSAAPEAKAKIKTQLIGLVVSGVVVWGAFGIWRIVYNFMDGLTR